MSGIAVIFRRDGAPVGETELTAMTSAMAHRAIDGVRHEIEGPVGIGFCSMATTPAPPDEHQPFRCRGRSLLVAFDGRLDDRRSLVARLGPDIAPDASDARLLGRAIERWGAGLVDHLTGDFAIVIADPTNRRVVCVRDHLGVRPLYYASLGPLFVAASDVAAVLAHPGVPEDLDPSAFQEWASHWVVPEGTIYRSISTLPMASILVATANGVLPPTRYWEPSCEPDVSRTPDDLVEEYRWLVTEATRDRLRSRGPVVVAMSGGLDSTSLATAAMSIASTEPGAAEVRLASLVFPGHPRADESDLIRSMERHLGRGVRRVRPRPRPPEELAAEIEVYRDLPDVPNDMLDALARPDLGERVLLSGVGGDEWFYAPRGLDLARAVRQGRMAAAVRLARSGAAEGRFPSAHRALWQLGLRQLPKVAGAVIGRSASLSQGLARYGGRLGSRFLEASWCPRHVPLDTASVLATSRHPLLASRLTVIGRRGARAGFEHRHPLHDIRLVQLSLSLPGHLRVVDGDCRWLPRRAAEGALPDEVRLRRDKAEFSVIVREELELARAAGVLERAMASADAGSRLHSDWHRIEAMDVDAWHPRLTQLWSMVAIQVWRETLVRPAASVLLR